LPGSSSGGGATTTTARATTTTTVVATRTTTTAASTTTSSSSGGSGRLPSSFSWNSSGLLAAPKADSSHNPYSLKDPSIFYYNGKWHVYATVALAGGNWNMVYFNFADWSQASSATQTYMDTISGFGGYKCAPQVVYHSDQKLWYLIFQSPNPMYATTTDPSNPRSWSTPKVMVSTQPSISSGSSTGWIDFWTICDTTQCHLFFANDGGKMFRMSTSKSSFPTGWGSATTVISQSTYDLFEGTMVYKLKGSNTYLALMEAIGSSGRYYKAFTSSSLTGSWTAVSGASSDSAPFAGNANVAFSGTKWSQGVSHGELIRAGTDEYLEIDTCNLQFFYQGLAPGAGGDYQQLPYRLGLLTSKTKGVGC
ncbi:hypothetical protein HDV00_010362, partial [Rhizophlyctis rosea]